MILSDHRVGGVVVQHVSAVRGKLVAQEDVSQAEVENKNQEVEKFAENKLSKISVGLVLQNFEVLHVVRDCRSHAEIKQVYFSLRFSVLFSFILFSLLSVLN